MFAIYENTDFDTNPTKFAKLMQAKSEYITQKIDKEKNLYLEIDYDVKLQSSPSTMPIWAYHCGESVEKNTDLKEPSSLAGGVSIPFVKNDARLKEHLETNFDPISPNTIIKQNNNSLQENTLGSFGILSHPNIKGGKPVLVGNAKNEIVMNEDYKDIKLQKEEENEILQKKDNITNISTNGVSNINDNAISGIGNKIALEEDILDDLFSNEKKNSLGGQFTEPVFLMDDSLSFVDLKENSNKQEDEIPDYDGKDILNANAEEISVEKISDIYDVYSDFFHI